MSLIRIAVPGQPVILVDEGPNTGRTSASTYGIRNIRTASEYVVVAKTTAQYNREARAKAAK